MQRAGDMLQDNVIAVGNRSHEHTSTSVGAVFNRDSLVTPLRGVTYWQTLCAEVVGEVSRIGG